jgi:uncharacterized protein (TIGR00369 family)
MATFLFRMVKARLQDVLHAILDAALGLRGRSSQPSGRRISWQERCKRVKMSLTTEAPVTFSARNGHSRCVLCGNLNPRSLNLSFQVVGDGSVRTRFKTYAELQGYDGLLHGGVIASLLDAAMTHCLFHHGVQAVTGDLHVRFVQPVSCDVSLEIRAWVLLSYPPLYRLKAEIILEKRVMAWAEAKFMQRQVQ